MKNLNTHFDSDATWVFPPTYVFRKDRFRDQSPLAFGLFGQLNLVYSSSNMYLRCKQTMEFTQQSWQVNKLDTKWHILVRYCNVDTETEMPK